MEKTLQANTADLSAGVQIALQEFCRDAAARLGDSLLSIVLYGDAAKHQVSASSRSRVDVMLVLRDVNMDLLDQVLPLAQVGAGSIGLSLLTVSREDLQRSTDVFPIKFRDIQDFHRLLWGADVVTGLAISDEHLRLRCEQEVKNQSLRLRRLYLMRGHQPEQLRETLADAATNLLRSLRAFLTLKEGLTPSEDATLPEVASKLLDIDGQAIQDASDLKHEAKVSADEVKRRFGSFLAVVDHLAELIDRSE